MVELILISAVGMIVLFAGITVLMTASFEITGIFMFLTLLFGYILIVFMFYKKKKFKKAKRVVYQGFENILFYISICVVLLCSMFIYLEIIEIKSMFSPVITLSWIIPLIGYLNFDSVLIFYEKNFCFRGQLVRYKDVKSLEVFDYKKNRKKMILHIKGKEMIYTGRNSSVLEAKENMMYFCHCKEIGENL